MSGGGGVWKENSGKLRDVSEDSYLFSLISSVVIKIQWVACFYCSAGVLIASCSNDQVGK